MLYCFYQGSHNSDGLWYNVFDGKKWAGDLKVPGTGLSLSPFAVVFHDMLYCFHQSSHYSGGLWYNVFDGAKWANDMQVPGTGMSSSPSAIVFNFELLTLDKNGKLSTR
jgi:hypothetical protein